MNIHATVHLPSGSSEAAIPRYIAQAMRAWRQWIARRGFSGTDTAYMWVRETHGTMTSHVHILLHAPSDLRRLVTNKRIARFFPKAAGIDISLVTDNARDKSGAPVLVKHRSHLDPRWALYVAKGVGPDVAHRFPKINHSPQGTIIGKRFGISENIADGEQRTWEFEEGLLGPDEARLRWQERNGMAKRM